MTLQFNYVRKIDGNGNKSLNLALPYEAYTRDATGIDPGRDNITGTADDQHAADLLGAAHLPDVRPDHRAHRAGRRRATTATTRSASR